jgi:hypothetical protein
LLILQQAHASSTTSSPVILPKVTVKPCFDIYNRRIDIMYSAQNTLLPFYLFTFCPLSFLLTPPLTMCHVHSLYTPPFTASSLYPYIFYRMKGKVFVKVYKDEG